MSCRWSCQRPTRATPAGLAEERPDLLAILAELARERRLGEFCWLARSEGVPAEDAEVLWARLCVPEASEPSRGRRGPPS